ncbi:MAG: hypothetical protein CSYNP_03359 [Syntrophus sp. SKADARSKE-3]|nr:hypothetical protein [Syntrophus sp. SKADARSKE-3]
MNVQTRIAMPFSGCSVCFHITRKCCADRRQLMSSSISDVLVSAMAGGHAGLYSADEAYVLPEEGKILEVRQFRLARNVCKF